MSAPLPVPVSAIAIVAKIEWRTDSFGTKEQALYLGNLCVGHIMHSTSVHVGKAWRGWFMSDEDGEETGWFETADEARRSVVNVLVNALLPPPR